MLAWAHVRWRTATGSPSPAMSRRRPAPRNAPPPRPDRRPPVGNRRITVGGDKGFDARASCRPCVSAKSRLHIAIDGHLTKTGKRRKTAIDQRTLRHPGYAISQRCRKRIEAVFGWTRTTGGVAGQGSRPRRSAGRLLVRYHRLRSGANTHCWAAHEPPHGDRPRSARLANRWIGPVNREIAFQSGTNKSSNRLDGDFRDGARDFPYRRLEAICASGNRGSRFLNRLWPADSLLGRATRGAATPRCCGGLITKTFRKLLPSGMR